MKQKEISFIEFINLKINKLRMKRKKESIENLTTDELIKYNQLKTNEIGVSPSIFIYPFIFAFWIALFKIVIQFAYGKDLSEYALLITELFFRFWFPLGIILFVLFMFIMSIPYFKGNRKLLRKIILERKGVKK